MKKRALVFALGSVAVLAVAGLAIQLAWRESLPEPPRRFTLPRALQNILQREEAGTEDVPALLELYRRHSHDDAAVEAIRAIGEPESVKEVEGHVIRTRRTIRKSPKG